MLCLLLLALGTPAAADPPLTVPAGFAITKVAGPPLVTFPVVGSFDDRGRLYVVDVAGPVTREEVAAKKPLHRIVRLEDADGDGTFDRAVTFADKLPFPEGCLFHAGSVYTACPPHILKLTDTDGDGTADKREVWFDGGTLTGCANDLHGPYRGPDGLLYWTKGAFAKQTHALGDGTTFTTRAAHVFRAKPDGSGREVVMTGGMDNPVGVAFTASGDVIVSNTFLQHPAGGKRDGLIHAVPGGVWGKDHDPIYDHPWPSPKLMPVMTHLGPAAPAGITRYESDQFGFGREETLFCAQFNLRKVSRHVLVPKGSTYQTTDRDFVTSGDPDFHPTDVIEAADGSLLVVDTGGWYKLCCPSSQLVKADARGGIYRVKKVGAHANVRKPVPIIVCPPSPDSRLKDDDPHARRWAVQNLKLMGWPAEKYVSALLDALGDDRNDPHLECAIVHELVRAGDYRRTAAGLSSTNPWLIRGTLAALQAIGPDTLRAEDVVPHLAAADADLRETAWWVAAKHPGWGPHLVTTLRHRLAHDRSPAEQDELAARLAKFAANGAVQQLLAETAANPVSLRAMGRANLKTVPVSWPTAVAAAMKSQPADAVAAVRQLAVKSPPQELAEALRAVAGDGQARSGVRLAALAALPDMPLADDRFAFALASLAGDAADRAAAADVFARATLSAGQWVKVAAALPGVNPVERGKLLLAFARSTDEAVGLALVAALGEPKVRAAVRSEQVRPVLARYPAAVQAEAAKLYAVLDAELLRQREKLEALVKELPAGDAGRGRTVFNGPKAACAACHTIGYVGGTTGPDLTKVGGIRTGRDLLESIVFPSASFVRSYEPVRVVTTDGRQFDGILKTDAATHVILATAAGKEERIARGDIESLQPGAVSLMPAGLDQQLSKQELADLVAFLRACK